MTHQVCAGLAVFTALACQQDRLASRNASPLLLTATVSSPSLTAGQPDTITVALTNTAVDAITLQFTSGCQILPYIADERGTVVLPSGGGWYCAQALTQRSVAPGETQTQRFIWAGSTAFASEMPLLPLRPGVYYVYATLHADEADLTAARVPMRLE